MKQLKTCAEYSAGLTISQIGIRKYLNEVQKSENKGDSLGWKPKNLQKAKIKQLFLLDLTSHVVLGNSQLNVSLGNLHPILDDTTNLQGSVG